jgi:Ca2+-binding EF-hand superfamily protein
MVVNIQSIGKKCIAAGSIENSFVNTGTIISFFLYPNGERTLSGALIESESVFDKLHLENFVGRKWLLDEIDAFLSNHERGYFIIEAKAGMGKTAFLAWLIRKGNYIHHFIELSPGQKEVYKGIENLAAQLILRYKLDYESLPPNSSTPNYLYKLLNECCKKKQSHEKIILVVDGLDEAGMPEGQNVLGLPSTLPKDVYFIVSMRVGTLVTLSVEMKNRYVCYLHEKRLENLSDMRELLKNATKLQAISTALKASNYSSEQFVETLMVKSEGMWIYVKSVVDEIEQGEKIDLDSLPTGLSKYYIKRWMKWRNEEDMWGSFYLPLLSTLAAIREEVTLDFLLKVAPVDLNHQKGEKLLKSRLLPFLTISNEDENEKYRFYHTTLREFFEGKMSKENLTTAESSFLVELTRATKAAHNNISGYYLTSWGFLEEKLPLLKEKKDLDEGYGLRHLVDHLKASGRFTDLHCLLALRSNGDCNTWFEVNVTNGNISGYISDVILAWKCAEESYNFNDIIHTGSCNGLQNRYALIICSVRNLFTAIPPQLLTTMVKCGVLTYTQGLAYAQLLPTQETRFEAFKYCFKFTEVLNFDFGSECLDVAKTINYDQARIDTLINLASGLPDTQITKTMNDIVNDVRKIKCQQAKVEAFIKIASIPSNFQKNEILQEALITAHKISDDKVKADMLIRIAPLLQDTERYNILEEVYHMTLQMEDDQVKADIILEIASAVTSLKSCPEKDNFVNIIYKFTQEIREIQTKADIILTIAPCLPQSSELISKVLDEIRKIESQQVKVKVLLNIAPKIVSRLDNPQRIMFAYEVFETIKSIDNWPRVDAVLKFSALLIKHR